MKFAQRAIIDDTFIHVMLDIYRFVLENKTREAAQATRYNAPSNLKPIAARLQPILNGVNDGRVGLDYEKTRLRILPYTHYSALNYGGQLWLTGRTHPVIIEAAERDPETRMSTTRPYHMGPYKVCVPLSAFEHGSLDNVHFIPLKNPKSYNRHPHHHAEYHYEGDYQNRVIAAEITHPLQDKPRTCWGNYGSILLAIINDGDIPELFRQFYIYLTRYNSASPLIHPLDGSYQKHGIQCVDFDTITPWEEK
jgi:hypothetical protein